MKKVNFDLCDVKFFYKREFCEFPDWYISKLNNKHFENKFLNFKIVLESNIKNKMAMANLGDYFVIVEFQGFKDKNNKFIVLELAIVSKVFRAVYRFQAPPFEVDDRTRQSNEYLEIYHHGHGGKEGLPYVKMEKILNFHISMYDVVLTKGSEKAEFLRSVVVNRPVMDCTFLNFSYRDNLMSVGSVCDHGGQCALNNALYLLEEIDKYQNPPDSSTECWD